MKRKNSTVYVYDNVVEKISDTPMVLAEKYDAVYHVANKWGFASPRVIGVESDRVVLERLRDIIPFAEIYLGERTEVRGRLIEEAGAVLGHLHHELQSELEGGWDPPARFTHDLEKFLQKPLDLRDLPRASLHCDYSFANVFVTGEAHPQIVVIDPCANFGSTFSDWTRGPIYLDIGKMLACLEGQVSARHQLQRPAQSIIDGLQQRFMVGYESATGIGLDVATAHGFGYAVANAQFHRRYGRLGKFHTAILYNRLRGNFPARSKIKKVLSI